MNSNPDAKCKPVDFQGAIFHPSIDLSISSDYYKFNFEQVYTGKYVLFLISLTCFDTAEFSRSSSSSVGLPGDLLSNCQKKHYL